LSSSLVHKPHLLPTQSPPNSSQSYQARQQSSTFRAPSRVFAAVRPSPHRPGVRAASQSTRQCADRSKPLNDFNENKAGLKHPDDCVELKLPTKPPDESRVSKLPTKPPNDAVEPRLPTKPPDDDAVEPTPPINSPDEAVEPKPPTKPPDDTVESKPPTKPPDDNL